MMDRLDVPDADYTPNPGRAIWVQGEFNQALEDRLRPQILELRAQSQDPISVFIDSRGGNSGVGERILDLLRSPDLDGRTPWIITVAVRQACSGAAVLLSAGDFAISSYEARLLYHGIRFPMPDPITREWATLIAEVASGFNEREAAALARKCAQRLTFAVTALRGEFGQHRRDTGNPALTHFECFQAILREKLSPNAQTVLAKARTRWENYKALLTHFHKKLGRGRGRNKADLQKIMLSASVAFEYQTNSRDPAWSLDRGGFHRIREHFSFLDAYFGNANGDEFHELCGSWAPVIPAEDEHDSAGVNFDSAYFLPFRSFAFALCGALQEGENYLTPVDAMMLGLVDTVREREDLTASQS